MSWLYACTFDEAAMDLREGWSYTKSSASQSHNRSTTFRRSFLVAVVTFGSFLVIANTRPIDAESFRSSLRQFQQMKRISIVDTAARPRQNSTNHSNSIQIALDCSHNVICVRSICRVHTVQY